MTLTASPGVILTGAVALQTTLDSAGAPHSSADSVAAHPTFSDPVIATVQFFFQQSPIVMWGGLVLAIIVAVVVLRAIWIRRVAVRHWLATRSGMVKGAMVAGVVVLAVLVAGL